MKGGAVGRHKAQMFSCGKSGLTSEGQSAWNWIEVGTDSGVFSWPTDKQS